ncbi:hypothetical protein [Actinoplanes sp. NPDC051851]|uniref:class I SAM-dependent methyltransferase n=1 Tax=Actinoplanes sp. NPDC051851 TaxID=3154753 RepID=UPI0034235E67
MIRLIGGEMPDFTEVRPAAGGALYRYVTGLVPAGSRVLVAGPHDGALIGALAGTTTVTCLIRSELAAAELSRHGATVLCGTLAKLTDAATYDVVIALDGTGRLCSVEGPQLEWAEAVRALTRVLRPGGTLLLAVENQLGVHHLVETGTPTGAEQDDEWGPLGEFDSTPGHPDRLALALTAEGLSVSGLAGAWPSLEQPSLVIAREVLQDGPVPALAAITARTVATAYEKKPVLSDPRRLASAAVRRGLGTELAPAWLVVAERLPREGGGLRLPSVLISPGHDTGHEAVLEIAEEPGGGWGRRVLRAADGVDPAVWNGPLPTGRLLEELLLDACLRHDLPRLRRLLSGWATALPGVTADNVLVEGDRYARLDPTAPDRPDALARFVAVLLGGGYAHPWPTVTDPARITGILASAAGIGSARLPAPDLIPAAHARREQEELVRTLQRQLAGAEERNRWYEREIRRREVELGKARVQIETFSGSLSYRLSRLAIRAVRKIRKTLSKIRKGQS